MAKQKKNIFEGVGTALITPFKNGRVDYRTLESLIERQVKARVEALIIGGTTGEAATLSDEERYELYERSGKIVGGRTRLIFGTGTNDTKVAIRHTKVAERMGCDGVLLVTPYYNKGTKEGVYRHYESIANSTNLPIILYNVPSRTGVNLEYDLLERLADIGNIVALKEASDSLDRLVELSSLGDKLSLYAGNDTQIYSLLSLGGAGVISVVSNLYPEKTKEITDSFFRADLQNSLKTQHALLPIIKSLFLETNPAPLKYAMSTKGLCSSEMRLPMWLPSEKSRERIDKAIRDFEG